jgi:WD40 repeat protein
MADESDPEVAETRPERPSAGPRREAPIDHFEAGREIGRGGMGRVIEAHDRKLDRVVAVKRLLVASGGAAERFRREARLTARLQHPGIVPVYEHGEDEHGAPYYAMRLVEGTTLANAIDDAGTLEKRIALVPIVLQVADTIAYAHAQHVIHRDLKPSNVMLGAFGETLVVDWGIARDLAEDDIGGGRMTGAGAVMGTPSYMAPEQAAGDDVDQRADVYALGGILYHVLAGVPPYPGAYAEAMEALYSKRPEPLATRAPAVPTALVAIVDKAMAERPEDRYVTARELADDLRRFHTGQLVAAHRYTIVERALRLARRHRAVLLGVLGAVVAATIAIAVMFARVIDARDTARRERDASIVARARAELDRDPSRVDEILGAIDRPELRASARTAGVATVGKLEPSVDGIGMLGDRLVTWSDGQIVVDGKRIPCSGGAGFSLVAPQHGRAICAGTGTDVVELATGARREVFAEHLALVQLDASRIAGRDGAGTVHVIDARTFSPIGKLPPSSSPNAIALAGDRVVIARGVEVVAWDPATGAIDPYQDVDGAALAIEATSDRVAVLQLDGTLRIFDATTRKLLRTWKTAGAHLLRIAPDGNRIAVAIRSDVHVYPIGAARRWHLRGHAATITDIAWTTRGPVSASRDGTLRTWHLAEPIAVASKQPIVQPRLAFGADRALVWDLEQLREVQLPSGNVRHVLAAQVAAASYAPDGTILVGEFSGGIRRGALQLGTIEPGPIAAIAGTPDGRVVVLAARTKKRPATLHVWDRSNAPVAACEGEPRSLAPDASRAIVAAGNGFAVCELATRALTPIDLAGATDLAFTPDGGMQLFRADAIELRDVRGRHLGLLPLVKEYAIARGRYAIASPSTMTVVEHGRIGEPPRALRAPELDGASQLVWSADAAALAAVTRDHVCVFAPAVDDGYCLPHDRAGEAWFSADRRWLATSAPGEVLVWNLR